MHVYTQINKCKKKVIVAKAMLVDGFCQGHEYSVQEVHTSGDMYAFSGLIDAGPTKI